MTAGLLDRLDGYLTLRRALGFAMKAEERLLRDFLEFVDAQQPGQPVRAATAVDWATSSPGCGAGGRARRLTVVRGFLGHLRTFVPQTELPGPRLLPRPTRGTPRLFSEAEVDALTQAARGLGPAGSLRPHTYATLIGLLASTGLRAGEACRLGRNDVCLHEEPPRLVVRRTKFRKTRLVPLHASAVAPLREYAELRRRLGYDGRCDTFFVSERRRPLAYGTLEHTFVALARGLALPKPHGTRHPSLHGLRHGFAVRRLLAWYREGADVWARLPELSVYLGHLKPQETFWYLTATPELLRLAAGRFEALAGCEEVAP